MCSDGHPAPSAFHDVDPPFELPLQPVDALTVTMVMDNVSDVFMPDQGPAKRFGLRDMNAHMMAAGILEGGEVFELPLAEHGFSALIEIAKGDDLHTLLFDAGTSPDGVVENMRRLNIDATSLEAIICSHGHFDHTTGIDGLIRTLGRTNLPVLIHPHFWRRRRVTLPGQEPLEIPTTSRSALEGAGFDILEHRQPSFLFQGSVLVTGEVARTTGYEPGFPVQQAWLDGAWEPDPLVLDDQALVIDVKDKGLVVMTGCGHAGVVNICRYAQRLVKERPIYAVIGGFHLNGPLFEPLIPLVCDDLAVLQPKLLVPAHCTGWRAQHALAGRFPDAFVPNSVGTRLVL